MIQRKKLNSMVVATLGVSNDMRAIELYRKVQQQCPEIMRQERVDNVKSFAAVIRAFPEIESHGTGVRKYALKKQML